ncbi:MAG: hypothetical protein ACOY4I_11330 [Bacillota bacterium]
MNFGRYRESLHQIQMLAGNYINLNKSDLARLNTLNGECVAMKEDFVKSFSSLVDEVEDGLTVLIDRLEAIKEDLGRISGPEGTLEDIVQLEAVWRSAFDLRENILKITSGKAEVRPEEGHGEAAAASGPAVAFPEAAPDPGLPGDIREQVTLAREEAAAGAEKSVAAIEPAQAPASPQQIKPLKKEVAEDKPTSRKNDESNSSSKKAQQGKKEQKPHQPAQNTIKPLPVSKIYGEAEKKLMEEINKNIELIKGNKKK